MSKRKLPRRELPYLTTLLDKLPFSKLPTNGVTLRRFMFEIEQQTTRTTAAVTVKSELIELWEYAGYGDILQDGCNILRQIYSLHDSYKKLMKTPTSRRNTESFKKKEADFTESLELLFDISKKSLHTSGLITDEDRDFLLNHWDKTISSTQDRTTKVLVEKKLARKDKYLKFASTNSSPKTPTTLDPGQFSDSSPNISLDSGEEFTPKRICTPRPTGTTVEITKDVLKKLGPAADRLNLSNNVLTSVVAAVTNHGGGDIEELSLSKSTARRQRSKARAEQASSIKGNSSLTSADLGR